MVLEEFPEWHERRNKIFWRGSTTGGGNNPAGRQLNYQRHRFIRMTSDNSTDPKGIVLPPHNGTNDMTYIELPMKRVNEETVDAAFTSLDGCGHEKVCDAVREGGYRISGKVPLIDVTKYKMLIDIDGKPQGPFRDQEVSSSNCISPRYGILCSTYGLVREWSGSSQVHHLHRVLL